MIQKVKHVKHKFGYNFSRACGYLDAELEAKLDDRYSHIISQLYLMMNNPDKWTL